MSDNKPLPAEWVKECEKTYGRVLNGTFAHWCYDFDGLPMDETLDGFYKGCTCYGSHNQRDEHFRIGKFLISLDIGKRPWRGLHDKILFLDHETKLRIATSVKVEGHMLWFKGWVFSPTTNPEIFEYTYSKPTKPTVGVFSHALPVYKGELPVEAILAIISAEKED
jgi:hypothetical protein